jgi:hypothetical protein
MLVRVGSTVCWGKVGSASAGAVTSGSGGTEPSGDGCAGTPASGRSALMVVPPRPVRDDRYRLNQPTPPIRLQALTQGARTLAGRQSVGSERGRRSGPGGRLAVTELLARVGGSSVTANCPAPTKEAAMSTWLWVLIIVVVLVLVFGVMRRRR